MLRLPVRGLAWLNANAILYLIAVGLVGFAIDGGVYAVLLNLFLIRLGYGPEQIGLVNSVGTLVFALTSLPAGLVGERWGSRRTMIVGIGIMAVTGILLPLADMFAAGLALAWLLGQNALLNLGLALFFVNGAPYLIGAVGAEQRNQAISLQTGLTSLSAFLGSLTGGLLPPFFAGLLAVTLERPEAYRYALMVAGLALFPALLALRGARPASIAETAAPAAGAPPATSRSVVRSLISLLILIALVRMLQVAGVAATNTFFNVYLDTRLAVPTAQIGAIIALARLLGVPAALASAALTARFGNRSVVISTSIATAICILPIALIPHPFAASSSLISVIGLSWIRYASSLVYYLELAPPSRRALVSGVTEMSAGLCFTAVTFGGGYIISWFGYTPLFLISAAITAISALAFWLAFREQR